MAELRPEDSLRHHWVDAMPARWRPYLRLARLDRPIGAWLLLWPCWWGLALEALAQDRAGPSLWHMALFFIGAFAMRAAGCTYNDIVDRAIDAQVERTRARPIASGQVSVQNAWLLIIGLCLLSLLVLLSFNRFTIWLGLGSMLVVAIYPFAKRFTNWPQIVLGLAFNWGALLGWTAGAGGLALAPLLLYGAGIAWTLGYDTIYAHQDKEDDALIGVGSTALVLGAQTKAWLHGFYLTLMALLVTAAGLAGAGPLGLILVLAAGAHLAWQLRMLNIDDRGLCLRLFRANHGFGALVFAALLLAGWVN